MASPPASPPGAQQRPMSAMLRSNRSSSRMSMSSRQGGGSRASDEDGKTAVKVAIRVRPPLKPDDPGYELVPQRFRGSSVNVTSPTSLAVEAAQGKKLFVFDRVFGEDIEQDGIWEYLQESVSSFVQGYNVSILAYGQSGAGKSYTMGTSGPKEQNDPRIMGVIPRAAAALFEKLTGTAQHRVTMSGSGLRAPSRYSTAGLGALQSMSKPMDRNWQLKATYVEIYQEQLRDLLLPESVPQSERSQVTIREDTKGRILLTGLHQATINSIDDLLNALNFGSSIRQTDATAINARSSRSHAVFSLNLIQKRAGVTPVREKRRSVPLEAMSGSDSWVTVDSKLHFVDLAGSERLKNTGAQGERAKEGISINAGLASLGKVISQLSSRSAGSHVSYRDSKLTRLLQDSLGGNAITYMVACINPAEFHLSETLNTVQYAQRARAIQIKPQIQQVTDDSDKQAVIDRLRAEVSFLRDQIRLSERTERRNNAPQERAERHHEREVELQNQLLDVQENYNALSQRHAKLISEITKARDEESEDTPMLRDAIGDSALERLKRSNSFAEGVEQLVLEYEKTIQTLEASLSQTRSSLASSESMLLERETKIAYMETLQQQLHARIQKAMDRESDSENYMRDLEARIDGITSGEEKSTAIIQELRKELTRTKENEASCEEYISTLEERLAEAEQDHDMMQREIDRLEHVVERQRSIGKLDNLLYELDHIRQTDSKMAPLTNGHPEMETSSHRAKASVASSAQFNGRLTPAELKKAEGEDEGEALAEEAEGEVKAEDEEEERDDEHEEQENRDLTPADITDLPQSPAQSKFVADKLDTVTQELFDLRMEHESTITDFEELQRKYQMALTTLAELQDAVDEARQTSGGLRSPGTSRPSSFLAHPAVNGLRKEDGPSSSRTLSSELSSLGESANTEGLEEIATDGTPEAADEAGEAKSPESVLAYEMEELKRLNNEKEEHLAELQHNYQRLHEKHQDTLDYVEELKVEVQKAASMARPASPTQVIRRKSSQNIVTTDRATRSIASLRNMALESFEDDPNVIQNFELNLNAIMTELHMRSERVQALEAEITTVRKEMESKMAIISGLTRERSSLKASSPMELSVVSSMQDQLVESENQMRSLKEAHAAREQELQQEIDRLKASLRSHASDSLATPPSTAKELDAISPRSQEFPQEASDSHEEQIVALEKEVAEWKAKHLAAMESMKASEQQTQKVISELEDSLQQAEKHYGEQIAELQQKADVGREVQETQTNHQDVVASLKQKIEQHKTAAATSSQRLADLEQAHAAILKQVEEDSKARELTAKELDRHRDMVASLEGQIEEHKAALVTHQETLASLKDSHSKEIQQLNEQLLHVQRESSEKLTKTLEEHKIATAALHEELSKSRSEHQASTDALQAQLSAAQAELVDLVNKASAALEQETDAAGLQDHIVALVKDRKTLTDKHAKAVDSLTSVRAELLAAKSEVGHLQSAVNELKALNEETMKDLERISEKERKSSRLVEELEEQLNNNYDQHQAATNRLSALQSERQAQLGDLTTAKQELERELEDSRVKIAALESQLAAAKRNSNRESLDPRDLERSGSANSNLRKSASHTSLPSPPPAIPLPPLPGSPPPTQAVHPIPSPPTSRHQSKDIAQAQLVEDQEARIRTIEKHLFAEKQLTATLEEALTDLEASSTKLKGEMEGWKKKCRELEEEVGVMRKERQAARHSLQAVEEERNARMRVEAERAHLEARMAALNKTGKKKKSTLNCF